MQIREDITWPGIPDCMSTAASTSIVGDGEMYDARPQGQLLRWIGSANLSSYSEQTAACGSPEEAYTVTGTASGAPITRLANEESEWGWTIFTGYDVTPEGSSGGLGALTFIPPFSPSFAFEGDFHYSAYCGFEPNTRTEEVIAVRDGYFFPSGGTFPLAADGTFERTFHSDLDGSSEIRGRYWNEGGVQRFTFSETWTSPPDEYSGAPVMVQSYSLDLGCASGSCVPHYDDLLPRRVSMQLRKHLVASGYVQSVAECMFDVPVRIQRRSAGRWVTVAKGRTDGDRNFRFVLRDRPGRYRAKTPAMIGIVDGISIPCASEVSATMVHVAH